VKELESLTKSDGETQEKLKEELKEVENEVGKMKKELEKKIEPGFVKAKDERDEVNGKLEDVRNQAEGLFAKQGRGASFRTEKERDEWLKTTIEEVKQVVGETEGKIAEQEDGLGSLRRGIEDEGEPASISIQNWPKLTHSHPSPHSLNT